jgi:hypothetical protein
VRLGAAVALMSALGCVDHQIVYVGDGASAGCGLSSAAFCEDFDAPHPGGRGGEIDEARFAFSRWGSFDGFRRHAAFSDPPAGTFFSNPDGPPSLCGAAFSRVFPPDDVRVCGGQLQELFDDGGGFAINSFMARQPFDFTGRTGSLVFEVDAKRNDGWDGHGWWLEIWITEEPAPIPYALGAGGLGSIPRNGVGFQIAPHGTAADADPQLDQINTIGARLVVAREYTIVRDGVVSDDPAPIRVRDGSLNRFRVEVSRTQLEIFGSDWDAPTELRSLARIDGIDLGFEVGYVHFQHVHNNAAQTANCCDGTCGCDASCVCGQGTNASATQVYRWDNIGFDGPVLPPLRGYDVLDSGRIETIETKEATLEYYTLGHVLTAGDQLSVAGVDLTDAMFATLDLALLSAGPGSVLAYRFNGNPWHEFVHPSPHALDGPGMTSFSLAAPLSELALGTNTIEFAGDEVWVTAVDLTVHPQ